MKQSEVVNPRNVMPLKINEITVCKWTVTHLFFPFCLYIFLLDNGVAGMLLITVFHKKYQVLNVDLGFFLKLSHVIIYLFHGQWC